jgi:hypothetical protein
MLGGEHAPPAGLMQLAARKWDKGTVLTRQQLLDARAVGPDR